MTMSNLDTLSTNDLFHSALEDSVKASTLSPLGDDSQVCLSHPGPEIQSHTLVLGPCPSCIIKTKNFKC